MRKTGVVCASAFVFFFFTSFASAKTESYHGVLVKSTNPAYTHEVSGENLHLKLGDKYNSMVGSEVEVKVDRLANGRFKVLSVTGMQNGGMPDMPAMGTKPLSGDVITGILVKNPNKKYTHKLDGQNINLNLGKKFEGYEGNMVEVKVKRLANGKIRVLDVQLMEMSYGGCG